MDLDIAFKFSLLIYSCLPVRSMEVLSLADIDQSIPRCIVKGFFVLFFGEYNLTMFVLL